MFTRSCSRPRADGRPGVLAGSCAGTPPQVSRVAGHCGSLCCPAGYLLLENVVQGPVSAQALDLQHRPERRSRTGAARDAGGGSTPP